MRTRKEIEEHMKRLRQFWPVSIDKQEIIHELLLDIRGLLEEQKIKVNGSADSFGLTKEGGIPTGQ